MSDNNLFWVVMRMMSFDGMELSGPLPFRASLRNIEEPLHFLPVFQDKGKADEWAEGGKYKVMAIQG